MKKAPEKYRLKLGPLASDESYGNNGVFVIPHPKISTYNIVLIMSDGEGWEHVSVSLADKKGRPVERCATWAEMNFVKEFIFEDEEAVMQIHPPKSQYVSTHPYCLHLWRPTDREIPLPDSSMVGLSGDDVQGNETKY